MNPGRREFVAAAFLASVASAARAEPWPTRRVTFISASPPGGSTDQIARLVAEKLQRRFGVPFVVDNRPGAGGTIGVAAAKRAAPDGYTILVSSPGPLVIAPHLMSKLGYDALRDFDYLSLAVQMPNVLCVPASSPFTSVADIVEFQRAQPDTMTWASSGTGTTDHLTLELFWQQTSTRGIHVPYKGGAFAITDLVSGIVQASFVNLNQALPPVRSGKLRALAVTGDRRSPMLADVPTTAESVSPELVIYSWQGFAIRKSAEGAKGVDGTTCRAIGEALRSTLDDPIVRSKLLSQGFEIIASSTAAFQRFQAAEYARWSAVIKAAAIRLP